MQLDILLLDNFDSFTYNLVDQFRALGYKVTVYRNNLDAQLILDKLNQMHNPVLVLSPGPGAPADAGSMPQVIEMAKGNVPMLGICLGQQALTQAYGGTVAGAKEIMHGKSSLMTHTGHPIFTGLANPMPIARYHSLVATELGNELEMIAEVDGQVMAICHEQDKVCGFQFHPESILTTDGAKLLQQSLQWLVA